MDRTAPEARMNRAIASCVVLLGVTVTMASAGSGVNIRWTSCFGDGGRLNRDFACDSNSGSNVLAVSFVLPEDLPQGAAVQVKVNIATMSSTLPDWWQLRNAGSCRQTELSAAAQDGPSCPDWALGLA